MVVKNLQINGFRNLKKFNIRFGDLKNLLYGVNGSGKTSIIEALYLLGFGKSFLQANKQDMTNFNSSGFFIRADIAGKSGVNTLNASYEKNFAMQLNNEKSPLAEIGKYLYPLFFSSLNYNLFIDHNPHFRKMIDRFIFGVHALYLHHILRYNHLVKQKNFLLKKLGKPINNSELDSWNKLLSVTGFEIVKKRMSFINQLNNEIKASFSSELKINYLPSLLANKEISETSLLRDLQLVKNAEMKYRGCLLGPQRDRFALMVSDKKMQLFSSGEKKKHLLIIYLAFINMFYRAHNDFPVFLIDDYDVAMDFKNLNFIIDHFPQMQIIATSVAKNDKFDDSFELGKEN
ncbi:DNA replication/repair protein RecF [candidate division KSB1 bacterium]|nr:DNA replication/repair protein RecF [Candidatus Aminicenantes bacterium]RQW03678.1 MAG: DNA replication/repair protein RecF [candidate division KSB1 bacterium]